jgi:anti-sigma factor RsiW
MRCEESRPLIDIYLDGELDALRAAEFELHAHGCDTCTPQLERSSKLRSAIRESAPYFAAPTALKLRIREALRAEAGVKESKPSRAEAIVAWWRWTTAAASLAAVALLAVIVTPIFHSRNVQNEIAGEVLSSHVRSLMASHLTDVTSTDRHTVKPWFDGKIDFAPNVPNFADQGFPLLGGRLDYIDHRTVAALVYQRRLHYINVFIWPTSSRDASTNTSAKLENREGYNILHWQHAGMEYWAVSDTSADDVQALAKLMQQ